MTEENYNERLAQMQEGWAEGKKEYAKMFGVCDVKKGEYDFQLVSAGIKAIGDYLAIQIQQTVLTEGDNEGTPIITLRFLGGTAQQQAFTRHWIEKMGYECPDDLTKLPDTLDSITQDEATFKGKLSFYNDRPQIDVIELLEGGEETGAEKPADKPPEKPEKNEQADKLLEAMQTFCATYQIDVDENADFDTLKAAIADNSGEDGYEPVNSPKKDEALDAEENQLLIDLGLEASIKKYEKPKAAPKKSGKKTSVKKSVKKKR